jgi:NAD(P)-dependent dehydrogenase (short-subunit alcohol dehydrogenase family)
VTGVSRGIGKQVALQLLVSGSKVYGIARSSPSSVQELIDSYPSTFKYHQVNLGVSGAARDIVEGCLAIYGTLDTLIHNAGLLGQISKTCDSDIGEWKRLFDVNFFSGIELVQQSLPTLRVSKGSVVIVSSGYLYFI